MSIQPHKLHTLLDAQRDLVSQLEVSISIDQIAPDNFDWPIKFGGVQKWNVHHPQSLAFISAYLKDSKGKIYDLTRAELLAIKPKALVHAEWKEQTI